MYYSDPGETKIRKRSRKKAAYQEKNISDPAKSNQGYYSEPDGKYFEIDYAFLKQLSKLAKININYRQKLKKSHQKTDSRHYDVDRDDYDLYEKLVDVCSTKDPKRKGKASSKNYGSKVHCQVCCSICSVTDGGKGNYSRCVCRNNSLTSSQSTYETRNKLSDKNFVTVRRGSVHSVKSVSFLDDKDSMKSPTTNYTGKSFTNDLKQFLLGPTSSRFNFREKFLTGFRASCEEKEKFRSRRSPSIGLIKGLWKSL